MTFVRSGRALRAAALASATLGMVAAALAQQPSRSSAEQAAVDRAREALQTRHEWGEGMAVQSVTAIDWPDSSLGCPKRGVSYMHVVTPGYTVVFTGTEVRREVHVAGERTAVCGGLVRETLKTPRVPLHKLDEMIEKARADLAMRLGGRVDEVTVARWAPLQLPARALRCEVEKGDPGEPLAPGYRIDLAFHGRDYTYRSDMETVEACPRIEAL